MTATKLATFGQRLAWAIEQKRWTQAALADAIDATEPHVSKLVNEAYEPRLSDVVKICRALSLNIGWLAEKYGKPWIHGSEPSADVESLDRRKNKKTGSGEHRLGVVVRNVARPKPVPARQPK